MTKEELERVIYDEVKADVETEADAMNEYQEGYSVGFNDCRARVVERLLEYFSRELTQINSNRNGERK